MVGVPGRSKGCVTCRKRKKGCDLQQPSCGQCKERGIHCGGYDADRIFVYQDTGSRRHARRAANVSTPPHPAATALDTALIVPAHAQRRLSAPASSTTPSFVVPASLFRSAFSEKSIEAFLDIYVPRGDPKGVNIEGKEFIDLVPTLTVRDEALRLATLAIGTVALGRQSNNQDIIRQGRRTYSQALVETRKALQDPTRARSTAILAIPRILAIYEILFSAEVGSNGNQAQSWLSHAEGEVALIVARGPESYVDNEQHCLFSNARFRSLVAAVRTRTPSVLNEEVWKTTPWRGRIKTSNDTLLDIFAAVPEILERVDKFGGLSSDSFEDEARDHETAAMCWFLHFQLEEWVSLNGVDIFTPHDDKPTPITEYPDLDTACLTVRYWVIALLLYSSLETACRIPPSDDTTSHPDRPHPRQFARWIARSSPYFFQAKYGISGATALSFPLGNAFLYFRRNPELDGPYLRLVKEAFSDPKLPTSIMHFLNSMRAPITMPGRSLPGRSDI